MTRTSMRLRRSLIVASLRYKCLEYLIKCKGYNTSYNSWEVHQQVHARLKIAVFHHNNRGAAGYIKAAISDSIPFTRANLVTSWRSWHVVKLHLWRVGDVRGHLSISPYSSFLHSFTPVPDVHIQPSCIKSDASEPNPLGWCWWLIHSWWPCDIDNFAQHGHPSHKDIVPTINVWIQAHIVLWDLSVSPDLALGGLVLYSFSILSVDRPSQGSLECSLP
jgi:hypothetical protein